VNDPHAALMGGDPPVFVVPADAIDFTATVLATGPGGRVEGIHVVLADGLEVLTLRKTGIRWGHGDPFEADPGIEDTASYAIRRLLLDRSPAGAAQEDLRGAVDRISAESTRLGALIRKRDTWTRRPVLLDGEPFALFELALEGAAVGVADVGPLRVAILGRAVPADLALRLTTSDRLRRPDAGD
jgi:hypothetical protein